MFFDFGPGEIVGLAVLAMILLGPDKLPTFAVDAARFLKKVRTFASNATNELKENLGPGFEDLQPSDLHPKTFIKKQIANAMDEDSSPSKKKARAKIDPDLL
ncbi:TatA Sec-independent protein secretion pathway components [Candidatus Nanopelagicaceae bacterium]